MAPIDYPQFLLCYCRPSLIPISRPCSDQLNVNECYAGTTDSLFDQTRSNTAQSAIEFVIPKADKDADEDVVPGENKRRGEGE